jgi:galactitol-specific phosphotransferase system IIB component
MATSEQIRNRIVELVKNNGFDKKDLLQVFSQLVHDGVFENEDIITIIKYLHEDILNAQTRTSYAKNHGKNAYNSHQFAKGNRYYLGKTEYITDNE